MKCVDVVNKLSAYADGELRGREAARLREHLSGCESCRKRSEVMVLLQSRLEETMNTPIDAPDLSDQVMNLLPKPSRPVYVRFVWAGAAVGCLVLLVVIALSLHAPQPGVNTRTVTPPSKSIVRRPDKQPEMEPKQSIEEQQPQPSPVIVESTRLSMHSHKKLYRPHHRPDRTPIVDHTDDYKLDNSPDVAVRPDTALDNAVEPTSAVEVHVERQMSAIDTGAAQMDITTSAIAGSMTIRQVKQTVYYLPPNPDAQEVDRPQLQTVEQVVRSS